MSPFVPDRLVERLAPFADAGRLWIALSGGLDSTVLLHAAARVRERLPAPLAAVHADHGLHPDAPRWAERCRAACTALHVPFEQRLLALAPTPGESLEALARTARYRAFAELLVPGDLLLTAHNLDDQAETLLLALLRGSGVHGLAAMPVAAPLGAGRLVRPLLDIPRAALADYARAQGLSWIEDPSNDSLAHDRNFLRHRVLPVLRERWPAASATLARSAAHCAEAAHLVDELAETRLPDLAGSRPGTLSVAHLLDLDLPRRKAVLRLWLRRQGFAPPGAPRLARIAGEVLSARRDAAPLVDWPGAEVRRYRGNLYALAPLPPVPGPDMELVWEGGVLKLPEPLGTLSLESDSSGTGALAQEVTEAPLQRGPSLRVRFGLAGAVCRPPARAGARTLKGLFQGVGVPAWLRPYCPLVLADGRLAAVAGVSRCEPEPSGSTRAAASQGLAVRWRGHPWESFGFFS